MTFGRGDIDLGFGPDSCFRVRDASGVRGKRRSDLNTIPPAGCGVGWGRLGPFRVTRVSGKGP